MSYTDPDNIFKCLEELENQGQLSVTAENHIHTLKFLLWYERVLWKWNRELSDVIRTWLKDHEKLFLRPTRKGSMAADLLEEALTTLLQSIEFSKDGFTVSCSHYFDNRDPEFYHNDVGIDELVLKWIDPLLENLKHLIRFNDLNMLTFPREQIDALVEKLRSLRNFLDIIQNVTPRQGLQNVTSKDLLTHIVLLIENATHLTYDSWANQKQERMEKLFFNLLVKIKHIEPEIRMIYVQLLKASRIANPGTLEIDLQALAAVDSLLDNLQKLLKDQHTGSVMPLDVHQIEFLHQELSFLKHFLMDPQLKQYTETEPQSFNSLLIQVEAIAREGASLTHSICFGQTKNYMADQMNLLHSDLLKIVNLLKAEIRQMYLRVPKPSSSSFPQTPNLGFLDFFLQSLDELLKHRADSIAYVKKEIETVQSELGCLRSFVGGTSKKNEENKHIARRVVDMAYEAECVIDMISASDFN